MATRSRRRRSPEKCRSTHPPAYRAHPHPSIMWARWYGPIVQKFRAWATENPAVRGAIIVGSQARAVVPADEWSDLDIVIFHTDPETLVASTDWVARFGEVAVTTVEETAVLGGRERRVFYADGRDVDFAVFPSAALGLVSEVPEGQAVLARGSVVLVDKDGYLARNPEPGTGKPGAGATLPSEALFRATVSDFWYHAQWVAKKLRRGELWTAKMGCDGYLKRLLLRLIEWQSVLRHEGTADTWHDGRFLDRWAEPEVRERLPATFARYEPRDLARGLRETELLFAVLAREIAAARGWNYPASEETAVRAYVERTLAEPV